MKLVYIPKPGFAAPGNSWPAGDHDEPSKSVAQAKLDSGFYREKGKRVSTPEKRKTSKRGTGTKRGAA